MFSKLRKSKAFTIIELLVVIAIIGLLAVLILTRLNAARAKARNATRKANLREIQNALELYADDHGQRYPSQNTWSEISSSSLPGALVTDYMASIPDDPFATSGQEWHYLYITNTNLGGSGPPNDTRYCLATTLETEGGTEGQNSPPDWGSGTPGESSGCTKQEAVPCNYYVCN